MGHPFTPGGLFYLSLDIYMPGFFLLILFIREIPVIDKNSVKPYQTRVEWRLILVYTVCQCPFYGTLGINGVKSLPELH